MKPLDQILVARELEMQHLDRDPPLDQRVFGEEHRPHSTFPQCFLG